MTTCPVCSSEMVYPLLNTLRCKRCKHIWKVGEEEYSTCRCPDLDPSLRVRKKTDPLEMRLARKLDEHLIRHEGKFSLDTMTCRYGDTTFELFRNYVKRCVNNRTLTEEKDRYGRIWYSRPGANNPKK